MENLIEIEQHILKNRAKIPIKTIEVGIKGLRGRKDCDTFKVSFDDYDTEIKIPYFKKSIGVPPAKIVPGSRYNRDGSPYLYLTSNIDTSIAELRLKLNEVCSIATFVCKKEGVYVDVSKMKDDIVLSDLYTVLMTPKSENNEIYRITQFVADIFKDLGFSGIVYPSTLTLGENLVCFYPEMFEFQLYSDKVYKGVIGDGEQIIPISQLDEFKKYPNYRKEMYSFGDIEEKEEAFDYVIDKIYYEDEQAYKERCNLIFSQSSINHQEQLLTKLIEEFKKTHLRKQAYQLRGSFYINNGEIEKGILDYIVSLNMCRAQFNTLVDNIIYEIDKSININNKSNIVDLNRWIEKVCNNYIEKDNLKRREILNYLNNI